MLPKSRIAQFEVLIEPDEDGFHVWCPALKGCHSFGLTKDEALENIKEAIEGWIEGADELGIRARAPSCAP
ncbi:MAG: type II toxin-antitoxin system HicB family antitoxin [Dehalococcoidia bacterium]